MRTGCLFCIALSICLVFTQCDGKYLVYNQALNSENEGLETQTVYAVNADTSTVYQPLTTVRTSPSSDEDSAILSYIFRPVLTPMTWMLIQLEAAQNWQRDVVNGLLSTEASSSDIPDASSPSEMLHRIGCGRFRHAMRDAQMYQQMRDAVDSADGASNGVGKYSYDDQGYMYGDEPNYEEDEDDEQAMDPEYMDEQYVDGLSYDADDYEEYAYDVYYYYYDDDDYMSYDDFSDASSAASMRDEVLFNLLNFLIQPFLQLQVEEVALPSSIQADDVLEDVIISKPSCMNWQVIAFIALSIGCVAIMIAAVISAVQLCHVVRRARRAGHRGSGGLAEPLLVVDAKQCTDGKQGALADVEIASEYINPAASFSSLR